MYIMQNVIKTTNDDIIKRKSNELVKFKFLFVSIAIIRTMHCHGIRKSKFCQNL